MQALLLSSCCSLALQNYYLSIFTVDKWPGRIDNTNSYQITEFKQCWASHLDSLGTLNAVVIFFLNLKAEKALTDHQLQHETVANAAGEKPVPAEGNSTISSMLSFNAR